MRNFTLGKNRIPLFFFALFLMIGTSSYGQCPTLTDQTPEEFCYLSTIADLTEATGATVAEGEVAWYRTATSTTPIPENELLEDENYFAGNLNGTCTERVEVIVTVDVVGPPTSTFGITFQPCVYLDENGEIIGEATVQDLANLLVGTVEGTTIAIYPEEFSENALPPETPLEEGENYFAGQFSEGGCPSSRLALRYDPILTLAPDAEPVQIFCEGATVADLTAQATSPYAQNFRWYSTRTSNPPLAPSTPLIDGETYYATQIINRSDSPFPPCESIDRVEVLAQVIGADAGEDSLGNEICQADLQARLENESPRAIFLSLLEDGVQTDGTFQPTIDEIAADYSENPFQTFQTTYSVTSPEGCTDSAELALTVTETYNAGADNTGITFCRSDLPETLTEEVARDFFMDLLSADADMEGIFSSETIAEITERFNSGDGIGTFSTTYTVGEGTACEDSAQLSVTVLDSPDAGEDGTAMLTSSDEPVNLFDFLGGTPDENGTFSPGNPDGSFDPSTGMEGTFTYTVSNGTCEDTATVTVMITDECNITAGEDNSMEICNAGLDEMINDIGQVRALYTGLLDSGVPTNGTFSPTIQELINRYESNNTGDFTTTYTVGEGDCQDSAELTLTVVAPTEADAGEINDFTVCSDDQALNLYDYLDIEPGFGEFSTTSGTIENGNLDISSPGTPTVTYTVNEDNAECVTGTDSTSFIVEVLEGSNAGDDVALQYCLSEIEALTPEEAVALFSSLLADDVDQDGTFSPSINTLIAQFSANPIGTFATTYTVGEGTACEDSAQLSVTVLDSPDAGEDGTAMLTSNDEPVNLFDFLGGTPDGNGTFSPGNPDGSFDPSTGMEGTFTYTVSNGTCEDTATVTVMITDECTITAGEDNSMEICNEGLDEMIDDNGQVRALYTGLLDSGVPRNGTFNPTISQIIRQYQRNNIGDFTTTYTVGEGDCQDSAELTLTVVAPTEADAGEINDFTVCSDDQALNLYDYLDIEPGFGEFSTTSGTIENGNLNISSPGTNTVTYTVNEDNAECVTGTDSTSFTVEVLEGSNAGDDVALQYCLSEIEALTPEEAVALFNSLLADDVDQDGTFSPSIDTLIAQLSANPIGTFATTYTVGEGDCQDSAEFTLTVVAPTEANAGEIENMTVCTSDEVIDLRTLIPADATQGGSFTVNGEETETFDPSQGAGEFEVVYMVNDDADCVIEGSEDSEIFVITVNEGADLGEDIVETICISDIDAGFGAEDLEAYFMTLVEDLPEGTFNPSLDELYTDFVADPTQVFMTTYTVAGEECGGSLDITLTINDVEEVEAGEIADETICTSDAPLNLFDLLSDDNMSGGTFTMAESGEVIAGGLLDVSATGVMEVTYTVDAENEDACLTGNSSTTFTVTVNENPFDAGADNRREICNSEVRSLRVSAVKNLFLNLLEPGIDRNGTFNPTIQELIDQYNMTSNFGDFTTTYTVGNEECQDSAVLTITVLQNPNAGRDATVTLEEDATETVDLFEALGGTPDAGGVWTFGGDVVDATFDPSTETEGQFTYTVTSENGCTDTAIVTIVIGEPVACPEITEPEQTFCEGATVADLLPADGLWYDSADATTPLTAETVLIDAGVYFAGDAEGVCEGRESVTVTIAETPAAPTVVTPFEDCVVTGATVADLDITAGEGNTVNVFTDEAMQTPAEETDLLVEGTYYVTQTNEAGCVSEAAMITVTLTDSEAPTLVGGGNVFCEFDQATIADLEMNISGDGEITWYASEDGTETVSSNEILENDVTYYAAMTDADSACESSERLAVTVVLEPCDIIIPEAFSPNGDGINDRFIIPNLEEQFPNFELMVYNRWGEQVYVGSAGTPGWDGYSTEGSFGDGRLPAGVYFYILYFNDGETAPVQGRVYLSI